MTIGSTSLEEQVVLLAKRLKALAASVKEKDEQIAFKMEKITNLIGKTTLEQNQHPSLQEEGKNSVKEVAKDQQQDANKVAKNSN